MLLPPAQAHLGITALSTPLVRKSALGGQHNQQAKSSQVGGGGDVRRLPGVPHHPHPFLTRGPIHPPNLNPSLSKTAPTTHHPPPPPNPHPPFTHLVHGQPFANQRVECRWHDNLGLFGGECLQHLVVSAQDRWAGTQPEPESAAEVGVWGPNVPHCSLRPREQPTTQFGRAATMGRHPRVASPPNSIARSSLGRRAAWDQTAVLGAWGLQVAVTGNGSPPSPRASLSACNSSWMPSMNAACKGWVSQRALRAQFIAAGT